MESVLIIQASKEPINIQNKKYSLDAQCGTKALILYIENLMYTKIKLDIRIHLDSRNIVKQRNNKAVV